MQTDNFDIKKFPNLTQYQSEKASSSLDICIATEEILGPVRNGGIASTYYHLAVGLAKQGHNVTVVLLKGDKVQQETPEYWVEHYRDKGVKLHYLSWPSESFEHVAHPWQGRCYSFYLWLKNHHFDIVHTSEWRGGAYYALMAKRLGFEFENTFFIVKASSPHIWNRHYQMQSIAHHNLYSVMHLEQKCIEWADMVVGGSAHLLSFMSSIGYELPRNRVYVQPNIVDFSFLDIKDCRVSTNNNGKHIVFFGRLETRKGLELFCDAIDNCVVNDVLPDSITFLGKQGVLSHNLKLSPISYIEDRAKHWPFEIEIITDKGQPEALAFLVSDNYVAVMPSLIENSTMTVYEAMVFDIPFLATDVGGTKELIHQDGHSTSLVKPEVKSLSEHLIRIIQEGQPKPKPAFDNQNNIDVWYRFHNYLSDDNGKQHVLRQLNLTKPKTENVKLTSTCIINATDYPNEKSIEYYEASDAFNEIILLVNSALHKKRLLEKISNPKVTVVNRGGASIGAIFNSLISASESNMFVVSNYQNTRFSKDIEQKLQHISTNHQCVYTSFFRYSLSVGEQQEVDKLSIPLGGDAGHQIIDNRVYGREVIFFSKKTFQNIGGFEEYNIPHGIIHNFVTQAILEQAIDLMVVPEELFTIDTDLSAQDLQCSSYGYLKIKAAIESMPLTLKKCLMFMSNEQASSALRNIDVYTPDRKGN